MEHARRTSLQQEDARRVRATAALETRAVALGDRRNRWQHETSNLALACTVAAASLLLILTLLGLSYMTPACSSNLLLWSSLLTARVWPRASTNHLQ